MLIKFARGRAWLNGMLLACYALSAAPVLATELTINEALKRTLLQSPALQLYPYQQRINDAATLQAGFTPNPELNISLENVLGNGSSSGVKSAELTLSLSQLIELGDKKQKRLDLSQWQSQLSQQQYQLAKVDALAATMRSFLELLHQQGLLQWTVDKIAIEQQALAAAKIRAKAGAVPEADVARLELRVLQSRMEQQALLQEQQSLQRLLAQHWLQAPDFSTIEGDLAKLPQLPPLADVLLQLQQAPQLQYWLTQSRFVQSQQQLAQALGQADLTVGAGIRRNEALNENALVLQLSMPLTLENPNQGNILASAAAAEQAELLQQQQQQQLVLQVERSFQQLTALNTQLHDYHTAVLPAAERVLQQMLAGYQQGLFDMTDLLAAQQEILQTRRTVLDLQYRLHLQLLEQERFTGLPLVVNGPTALTSPQDDSK
ncbi:TolC family protein [Rheinheimera riviphila]|uniref:TolC family protein n=1 Tax=Rheinheimera riviphila TaxID=1834037 RepID=A0A437QLM4_9GAMM|nr:TolC family protein [Rheinheimera riviphila]RVU35382.1 TolC family protein [Rheinheimera riviphila]